MIQDHELGMHSLIRIADLFETPHHIPSVARWIFDEFWADNDGYTFDELIVLLGHASQPDQLPLSLLARVDGVPVGTVNLIENDDPQRHHLRPWLAALYVVPEYRRGAIGSELVRSLLDRARRLLDPGGLPGNGQPTLLRALWRGRT